MSFTPSCSSTPNFKKLSQAQNIKILKKLDVCSSCLIKHHAGKCSFKNLHRCGTQSSIPKEMHNALIYPNKPDSSIAALTFDDDLATDPSVADALTLCQSLDLEPEDLFDLMDGGWSDDSGGLRHLGQ